MQMKRKSFWGRFLDLLFGERKTGDQPKVEADAPLWFLQLSAAALLAIFLLMMDANHGFAVGVPIVGSWSRAIGAERLQGIFIGAFAIYAITRIVCHYVGEHRARANEPSE
jgi:hypothetical protein